MAARFDASYTGIGEMLVAPFMQADMRRRADAVAETARSDSPVDATGPHPGRYRDAFHVTSGVREGRTRRAFGRVTNDSPEAVFVEFGSKNNDAHHTLGKALEAAGR